MSTKIEWTQETWNPITGCTKISAGCRNCYAERMSKRLRGRFGYPEDDPFRVTWHPDKLRRPTRWKKPRKIFVCSMGDLFHIDVRPHWLEDIFVVIKECSQHTFQILTKRPGKMRTWFEWYGDVPKNVQLLVSAENQKQADIRIPLLLSIPSSFYGVSIEPMLGEIDLDRNYTTPPHHITGHALTYPWLDCWGLDWVICGAETGPGKRPMQLDWARSVRDQCQAAGVPFFFKRDSDGNRELDGRLWEEMPE